MTDYRYKLDKSSKKFECPECEKKRFVRYLDTIANDYLPCQYGRCDREQNCSYHLSPYKDGYANKKPLVKLKRRFKPMKKKHDTIPENLVESTFKNYEQNNFFQFLCNVFGKDTASVAKKKYLLGTSKHQFKNSEHPQYQSEKGASIFWQIDVHAKVRTGKIMLYNIANGRRIKKPFNHNTWVHFELKRKKLISRDFCLNQCLFGEHLLVQKGNNKKEIAIVESEKTAMIMSIIKPNLLWMATGGSGGISVDKFRWLKEKRVILYPDLGMYERWKIKSKKIINCNVSVSKLLEEKAFEDDVKQGYDIADYMLKELV